ncbi:MAG: hypothetical protein A3H70_02610 [Candidatus Komeilibacteria bacterium RIFCSPLOWO2_02_FULL_48_11]|uniref:Uncharacterized protein n=1 Tax=Candidatus Komeilibacteria bacterium RIFCSPLOWO2_02_FULL_48_11 TaxID=1798553 RepID=A0A1G2BRK6_9BACT|nr:MAG: hypothetical protein A3H70_02610 [Candidatus Komeilibacteria bacterium RIFCSPLOWO2_02_FULL_48_11]
MYLTIHAAAGAAIGQFISNPLLAFILGFVSHFILDIIPHGDEGIKHWKWFKTDLGRLAAATLIDFFVLCAVAMYWLIYSPVNVFPGMIYGMAGAVLPDTLWGLHELTGTPLLNWYSKSHSSLHHILKKPLAVQHGFLIQIPLLLAFTWLIINL